MKVLFAPELATVENSLELEGDQVHHFSRVLRGRVSDRVLVRDGVGVSLVAEVASIGKKKIQLNILEKSVHTRDLVREIAIGVPKKEYLAEVLRSCTEIGVTQIHLIQMEFSPWTYTFSDRLSRVMISALVQSEALFLPEIIVYDSLKHFLEKTKNRSIVVFSTQTSESSLSQDDKSKALPMIGPEGGFSDDELSAISCHSSTRFLKLPNPIMKTVTAVPFCLGFMQA